MKLTLDPKNPRVAKDEFGNKLIVFTGLHLEDWREIIARINQCHDSTKSFSKKRVEI